MKKVAGILLTVLLVLCFVFAVPISASAASADTQYGLQASIVTNKDEYKADEKIEAIFTLTNTSDSKVEGVTVEPKLSEGLFLDSSDLTNKAIALEAEESYSAKMVLTTKKDLVDDTSKDDETDDKKEDKKDNSKSPKTNDTSKVVLWIVFFVLSAVCIFVCIKYRKSVKVLSVILCIAMAVSMAPLSAFAAETEANSFELDKTIKVGKKDYSISVTVNVPNVSSSTEDEYTVSFDLNYEGAKGAPEKQIIKYGGVAHKPDNPERSNYQFIGWFPEKEATDWKNPFDFVETKIYKDYTLYALWVNIDVDTDSDGLSDELEAYIGTDITNHDTDNDNLSDYVEVVKVGTDPLKIDTNDNGVTDYDEDQDEDLLSNGYECSIGTNPANVDSDNDLVNDYEEIYVFNITPTKEDTDDDGATDGWEIENGFDPNYKNLTFEVTESSEKVSVSNPVSASVEVELDGSQVGSLVVEPVSVADNPFISPSIPGYLGNAYEFSVSGEFDSATLTFDYDPSLGEENADFQPRIYYFNEKTRELEELKNQVHVDESVSAIVEHFSTYILLNKVDFDKVWETEIKPPLFVENPEDEATLDIMFVIDYSLSMEDNDPYQLFKSLSEEFIDKLRTDKDKAGAVKFIRKATLVSELTTDKDSVITAINGINYDNGYGTYSGTDGSAGIKMALDQMEESDAEYQYIVFITDGEDNGYSYSYDSLIATANESDVTIYAVGMGSASESILKKVSSQTGGKYYHATTGVSMDDLVNLDDVFEDIESETINLTTDSNNDGIPDYYNNLIKEGILLLSNGSDEFAGIDFNYDMNGDFSDDYDGDGLKNGDEICVVQSDTAVYLYMKSNPMMEHSDMDGISDYTESLNGSDPLMYQVYNPNAMQLYDDEYYYSALKMNDYDDNWLWKADTAFLAAVFGVWNKDELYRDIMIDYFSEYTTSNYVEGLETEETRKSMIESLSTWISSIKEYVTAPYGEINKITKLISEINGTSNSKTINYLLITTYKELVETFIEIDPSLGNVKLYSYSMRQETITLINLNAVNDKVGKICKGVSYISYGIDVVDTIANFSKVSANAQAFENNLDILLEIKNNSSDDHARDAASAIINKLSGSFGDEVLALGGDALEIAGKELIGCLSKANVYVLAVVAVRDGIDIITGISKDLKQHFQLLCYDRMTNAVCALYDRIVSIKGDYCYVSDENIDNLNRYLLNLIQLRILSERKYCEWMEDEGMIGWFTNNCEVEQKIDKQISGIKSIADTFGIEISAKL